MKPFSEAREFNKTTAKIAKALTMPKWYAEYMIELDNCVAGLIKVRQDIDPELIKKKVNQRVQEMYSERENVNGLAILRAISEGLYNKACAGEPMPWEVE